MDTNLDDSVTEYQRAVRGRATETLRDLRRHTLEDQPILTPSRRARRARVASEQSTMWTSSRNTEHCDYTYPAAVNRLRTTLQKYEPNEPKVVQFGASLPISQRQIPSYSTTPSPIQVLRTPPMPRGEVPDPVETVGLLQHQSSLLLQADTENKYCKDELHALKLKVIELVEENRLLHEEIKRSTVQEIIAEGIEVSGITEPGSACNRPFTASSPSNLKHQMTRQDYGRWQIEMERINALHTAKTTRMEVQLSHTRVELQASQKEIDELKGKLRMQMSMLSADPDAASNLAAGLCFKCAKNEAVLAASAGCTVRESLEKVSRERDELVTELTGMRARYDDLKVREEDAYQQVKRSVEMVEQAQLEQTQALVQREQLKEELVNMQLRIEEHAEQMQKKMTEERELVRKETAAEREELNTKMKELTVQLVESQNQLERVTRDKITLMSELHCVKGQIDSVDMDYGKATDSMKMSMTHATIERNAAMQEMKKLHKKAHSMEKELEQERCRLRTEGEDLRRRLMQAERSLVEAKEQCVLLANNIQELERGRNSWAGQESQS
ncbi:hypothetical protein LSAT2_012032 [Lamellibrachia satsuma]|nr:hypothetical protein LSAT2_012032 [Lamellibrachia satsuma]